MNPLQSFLTSSSKEGLRVDEVFQNMRGQLHLGFVSDDFVSHFGKRDLHPLKSTMFVQTAILPHPSYIPSAVFRDQEKDITPLEYLCMMLIDSTLQSENSSLHQHLPNLFLADAETCVEIYHYHADKKATGKWGVRTLPLHSGGDDCAQLSIGNCIVHFPHNEFTIDPNYQRPFGSAGLDGW